MTTYLVTVNYKQYRITASSERVAANRALAAFWRSGQTFTHDAEGKAIHIYVIKEREA